MQRINDRKRVMQGSYVDLAGKLKHGTFGFI